MRRVSENVHAEIYFWGCNPGFLTTSEGVFLIDTPQQPIDAVRWRERIAEHGAARYLVNTEPHIDHISGNAYFPGVEVIGQTGMYARYQDAVPGMFGERRLEAMKTTDPDSVWLLNQPHYGPNPPTRLFDEDLIVHIGNHTVRILHHPGHTAPQTTVWLPDEGVAFTGDNVFCRVKTFIQEANPWEWLTALEQIRALGAEVIVPGHGEPCDNTYLDEQKQVVQDWLGVVQDWVTKGMTEEEAMEQPMPTVDPYSIGQRLFPFSERLDQLIVSNLYKQIYARKNNGSPRKDAGSPG